LRYRRRCDSPRAVARFGIVLRIEGLWRLHLTATLQTPPHLLRRCCPAARCSIRGQTLKDAQACSDEPATAEPLPVTPKAHHTFRFNTHIAPLDSMSHSTPFPCSWPRWPHTTTLQRQTLYIPWEHGVPTPLSVFFCRFLIGIHYGFPRRIHFLLSLAVIVYTSFPCLNIICPLR
jgi:hypothetical protein